MTLVSVLLHTIFLHVVFITSLSKFLNLRQDFQHLTKLRCLQQNTMATKFIKKIMCCNRHKINVNFHSLFLTLSLVTTGLSFFPFLSFVSFPFISFLFHFQAADQPGLQLSRGADELMLFVGYYTTCYNLSQGREVLHLRFSFQLLAIYKWIYLLTFLLKVFSIGPHWKLQLLPSF